MKTKTILFLILLHVSSFAGSIDVATCTRDFNLDIFKILKDTVGIKSFSQLDATIGMSKRVCVDGKPDEQTLTQVQIQGAIYDGVVSAAITKFGKENGILNSWIQARVPRLNPANPISSSGLPVNR